MRTLYRIGFIGICLGLLFGGTFQSGGYGIHSVSAGQGSVNATKKPTSKAITDTPIPIPTLAIATPDANGEIVHVVQYGQTLITIAEAYGLSLTQLKELNGLTSDSITVGDKLIIQKGTTPTVTETPTLTATATRKPSATLKPHAATSTARPNTAITQTPRPTVRPSFLSVQSNRKTLGIGIVAFCLIGLVVVGLTGFRK